MFCTFIIIISIFYFSIANVLLVIINFSHC